MKLLHSYLNQLNNNLKRTTKNFLIVGGNDMKRTWATIKEIIGSRKSSGNLFPKRFAVNDLEIFNHKTIAKFLIHF